MCPSAQVVPQKDQKSAKRILVVDDDEIFRGILIQTLSKEGYQVTPAVSGNTAKDLLGLSAFDLVISDINMPGMSGVELMRQSKTICPELPFILMTGFAELKETEEASQLGAKGFIPKPFKKEELTRIIDEWLNPPQADAEQDSDLQFCKISIDDFVSGKEIKFDIYIRLSEEKYVKIAHEGENISLDRIQAYKSKGLQYLYMRNEDFKRYMGFNLALMSAVNSHKTISVEKKRAFLKHTSEVILENLFLNGVDEEAFNGAKAIVESSVALLCEPDSMMDLLKLLNHHSDFLYAHSLGVSVYSVMIGKQVDWYSPANIHKVAMGGLLHDIGKKELPQEFMLKQRKDYTLEDVLLYESHPQRGMEILSQLPLVPSDVLQVVLQHHEHCSGLGFPMRLKRTHIHPMARVVAVADEFCNLVLKSPNSLNLSPVEALNRMSSLHSGRFDSPFLHALMRKFGISPPKGGENKVLRG